MRGFIHLYSALLRCYPPAFRGEFADEMCGTFSEALAEAAEVGFRAILQVMLKELRDLPPAAWQARRAERNDNGIDLQAWDFLSKKELALALAAFAIPMAWIAANTSQSVLGPVAVLAGLAFLLVTLVAGIWRGFPRWSLPYLSLGISILGYLVLFEWVADLITPHLISRWMPNVMGESGRLLLQTFWAGFLWLGLFAFTFLIIGFLALLRRFRPLYLRIRQDWTLASFILYGEAMFALVVLFDEYRYEEPYAIASLLLLAGGAWLYLRNPLPWRRLLALLGALTLAMWVAALGKWLIVPQQRWVEWFQRYPAQEERWFEAGRTLLEWGWMVVVLLLPALMRVLSGKDRLVAQSMKSAVRGAASWLGSGEKPPCE